MELSDDESLRNLQLVCRDIRRLGRVVFAKRFMSARFHIFTEHSLQTLVNISTIPIYACQVKMVMLGCCRVSGDHLDSAAANPEEYGLELLCYGGFLSDGLRDARQVHDAQNDLHTTGEGMRLLVTAFKNFSAHSKNIKLGTWRDVSKSECPFLVSFPVPGLAQYDPRDFAYADTSLRFSGYGYRQLFRDQDGGLYQGPRWKIANAMASMTAFVFAPQPYETMRLLVDAAAQANCHHNNFMLLIDALTFDLSDLREGLLAHIRVLSFGVLWTPSYDDLDHCEIAKKAIASCSSLEVLDMSLDPANLIRILQPARRDKATFGHYFGVLPMTQNYAPSLRTLRMLVLHYAFPSFHEMIALLARPRQLETLVLNFCVIEGNEWMALVQWIAINLPKLSSLFLSVADSRHVHINGGFSRIWFTDYRFDGAEEVRLGLQQLLRLGDENISNICMTMPDISSARSYREIYFPELIALQ